MSSPPTLDRPLGGKRILITRAPHQSRELIAALETLGAQILLLPLVSFAPPVDWTSADEKLRHLHEFDAILFLSANAVRYVFGRAKDLRVDLKALFVAAVGPATARTITELGANADYVAREHTGHALATELKSKLAGRRVLLPRSDRGTADVTQSLRDAGARVTEFVAYRTLLPENRSPATLDRVRRAEVDAIVFASPSAVHNFVSLIGATDLPKVAARIAFAVIGPTTAAALRDASLPVAVQADDSSPESLASALVRFFLQHPTPDQFS